MRYKQQCRDSGCRPKGGDNWCPNGDQWYVENNDLGCGLAWNVNVRCCTKAWETTVMALQEVTPVDTLDQFVVAGDWTFTEVGTLPPIPVIFEPVQPPPYTASMYLKTERTSIGQLAGVVANATTSYITETSTRDTFKFEPLTRSSKDGFYISVNNTNYLNRGAGLLNSLVRTTTQKSSAFVFFFVVDPSTSGFRLYSIIAGEKYFMYQSDGQFDMKPGNNENDVFVASLA